MAGGMLTGPRWTDGHQSPGVLGLSQGARIVAKRAGRGFGEGPGAVFVAAAAVAYGPSGGGVLAFAGAVAAVSVSFVVVRTIGGKPLAVVRSSRARQILSQLDRRPVRTVFLLRLLFWMAPPINYALALSGVRFRSYLIGTALGLPAPIAGIVLLSDRLLN